MAVLIVMPKLGMVMAEGTVTNWVKAPGEQVKQGEVIAAIETEKLNYDLEATGNGIFHPVVPAGTIVPVDGLLGYLLSEGEAPPESPPLPTAPPVATATTAAGRPSAPSAPPSQGEVVASTPGARRLAANLGVDLSKVAPTGPRGRIVEEDVRAYAAKGQTPGREEPPGMAKPSPSKAVPIKGMRKAIAEHMRASISSTAQLSFFLEVDVTEAQQMRREASKSSSTTISIAHVLIKACAEALSRHPTLNTIMKQGNILYFDQVNIGVAVALDDGLIVPVLKDAASKDLYRVTAEAQELASKAREGKLTPDDVAGGTFTISVLGTVDGFTPILNPGQNAILGAGRSVERPVVRNGAIVVREMMTLSLTVDHQAIDGAVAASFLRRLQQLIERPAPLFLKAEAAG